MLTCKRYFIETDNDSAIKVIKEFNASDTTMFEQEVKILRSLRHPNIVLFMGVAVNVSILLSSNKNRKKADSS
jgi:serine/threonine protein kinase